MQPVPREGRRVYVEGRFQSRSWEGRDGVTRNTNEIVANQVLFLDRPQQPGGQQGGDPPFPGAPDEPGIDAPDADDLPF